MFERANSVIDEIIKEAMDRGKFNNLPGTGQPLKLDDETHVPEELKLAHKLLKDSGMAPDWIVDGKELREAREALIKRIRRDKRRYVQALENADGVSSPELTRRSIHMAWDLSLASLREDVTRLNRRMLGYNLRVPPGIPHLDQIHLERELDRA